MRDHRKLKAFQLADAIVVRVYETTRTFPKEEQFVLTAQMRRAAISVAANIVEGCARRSTKEYTNFLNLSFASLRETGYLFDLSHRLGYLSDESATALKKQYNECARILSGLIRSMDIHRS